MPKISFSGSDADGCPAPTLPKERESNQADESICPYKALRQNGQAQDQIQVIGLLGASGGFSDLLRAACQALVDDLVAFFAVHAHANRAHQPLAGICPVARQHINVEGVEAEGAVIAVAAVGHGEHLGPAVAAGKAVIFLFLTHLQSQAIRRRELFKSWSRFRRIA
jgi:hypothetical protein